MRIALCFLAFWLVASLAPADISISYETGEQEAVVVQVEQTLKYQLEVWGKLYQGTTDKWYEATLAYPVGKDLYVGLSYRSQERANGLQVGLWYKAESKGSISIGKTFLADLWELYLGLDEETQAAIQEVVQYIVDSLNDYVKDSDDA